MLFGLALFLRLHKSHPFAAGAALWLCSLKPHLFLPFALVLLIWIVVSRSYRILAGGVAAFAVGALITTLIDPAAWSQYSYYMRTSVITREFTPCLGDLLRDRINPSAEWIAFIPAMLGCIWALTYFWPRRHSWDWLENGSPLMLVSLLVAPFGWIFDQSLALPAVLYAVSRNASRNHALRPRAHLYAHRDSNHLALRPALSSLHLGRAGMARLVSLCARLCPPRPAQTVLTVTQPYLTNSAPESNMRILQILLSPASHGHSRPFSCRPSGCSSDPKDKTRPLLVFALVLNLFYGFLLKMLMGREGGLFPWKYRPHSLLCRPVSRPRSRRRRASLQGSWRVPLWIVYQSMVPMMIVWFLVTATTSCGASIVLAYVAELVAGPLLYCLFPPAGPSMPSASNGFTRPPSAGRHSARRHAQRISFSPRRHGIPVSPLCSGQILESRRFRVSGSLTCLATLSTGEHYIIDLIPGLAFGAFAASRRRE